jgi:hypothetical protein
VLVLAGLDRRVDRGCQRVPPRFLLLVLLEPAEAGSDRHERPHAAGRRERGVDREAAAHRAADQRRAPDVEVIEQLDEVAHR